MKKTFVLPTMFCFFLILMSPMFSMGQSLKEITVSAAISLKDPFEEIGKVFEGKYHGARIRYNFAGSGDLARQIEAGAPVDVFASAAQKDMDEVDKKGLIISNTRMNFAGNSVVLVRPATTNIRIESFEDLKKPEVKKMVIGNPKTVPAGRYAEEVLRYLTLWDVLKDRLVFAEHVRQALDYVARDEVDAGMVYATEAMARSNEVRIVMKAPGRTHQPVVYPIGVVKGSKNESLARDFIAFVLSTDGRNILKKNGFETVK